MSESPDQAIQPRSQQGTEATSGGTAERDLVEAQSINSAQQARTSVELLDGGAYYRNGVLIPTGEQYEEIKKTRDYTLNSARDLGALSLHNQLEADVAVPLSELTKEGEERAVFEAQLSEATRPFEVFYAYVPYETPTQDGKLYKKAWSTAQQVGKRELGYEFELSYSSDGYGSSVKEVKMSFTEEKHKKKRTRSEPIPPQHAVIYRHAGGRVTEIETEGNLGSVRQDYFNTDNMGDSERVAALQPLLDFMNSSREPIRLKFNLDTDNPSLEAIATRSAHLGSGHYHREGDVLVSYKFDAVSKTLMPEGKQLHIDLPDNNKNWSNPLSEEDFLQLVQGAMALIPTQPL